MMHLVPTTRPRVVLPATAPTYVERITAQANAWARHASSASRMREATLAAKADQAVTFTMEHAASSLVIPSKLSGVSRCQHALVFMRETGVPLGHPLTMEWTDEGEIAVHYDDAKVGCVQAKHVPWIAPLLDYGLSAHVLAVTGRVEDGHFLGLNVAFCAAAEAINRVYGSGDGAPTSAGAPYVDILAWRDEQGIGRTNIPHAVKMCPAGIDWGMGCAGAHDFARSILRLFAPPEIADRLTLRFASQVVTQLPFEGGLIRSGFVQAWLRSHGVGGVL